MKDVRLRWSFRPDNDDSDISFVVELGFDESAAHAEEISMGQLFPLNGVDHEAL